MVDSGRRAIRKWIVNSLPAPLVRRMKELRSAVILWSEFRADRRRYFRYSLSGEVVNFLPVPRSVETQLTKDYHRIEKGLALPHPKRPFGAAVADRISLNISTGRRYGVSSDVVAHVESAQEALRQWNEQGVIAESVAPFGSGERRGMNDVDAFFRTRHSVRDFANSDVADEILYRAVSLAINSPSVCNRQSWFVRFFRGQDVARILKYQNGNAGFTAVVPVVGLVTVDSRMFAAAGERNQPWIEGGIFSMSLVWALHALGVDTCMLNMSVRNRVVAQLRKEFGLEDNELVIMMVAIGYGREGHRVARSPRRDVDDVVVGPYTPSGER